MRKFAAWTISIISTLLVLMSAVELWLAPALIAVASLVVCLPTYWSKLETGRQTFPKSRLLIGAVLMIWSMVAWSERFDLTPEGRRLLAERAADDAKEQATADAKEAAEQERIASDAIAGKHCASGWDGSVRAFKGLVERSIRNPASFEHIGTIIGDRDNKGNHTVIMRFRAENGFGGMNVETATAVVNSADCQVLSWQLK